MSNPLALVQRPEIRFARVAGTRQRLILALYGAITETAVMPVREKAERGTSRTDTLHECEGEREGYPTTGSWCRCHTGYVCDAHFWMVLRALMESGAR